MAADELPEGVHFQLVVRINLVVVLEPVLELDEDGSDSDPVSLLRPNKLTDRAPRKPS